MSRPLKNLSLTAAAFLLLLAVLLPSCSEKEVPFVIDHEEISRYLETSEDARDLFRTDSLFPTDPYQLPGDTAIYRILVDSVRRVVTLDTHVDTVRKRVYPDGSTEYYRVYHDYGNPFGRLWDSEAAIDDLFHLRQLRVAGADTTVRRLVAGVTRYGFFLKLGGDEQPYVGWKLWAFNGGTPSGEVEISSDDGASFRGDLIGYDNIRYIVISECLSASAGLPCGIREEPGESREDFRRLDQLGMVNPGALLTVNCLETYTGSGHRLISTETPNGAETFVMNRVASNRYVDTVQAPDRYFRVWNLLFVQEYRWTPIPGSVPPDSQFAWAGWCVPYRLTPQ